MKKLVAILVGCAATAAVTIGSSTAFAATPPTADIALALLTPTPGSGCTLGVSNLGPDTVRVSIAPSNLFEKVYLRDLGPVDAGTTVEVEYSNTCTALESDKILFLVAGPIAENGVTPVDPNLSNNVVAIPYVKPTPAPAPTFGSS
ncbi:MAG: hypothetical protein NTW76_13065 [Corynebacteriales bacterium]|nr:hypothetical protein [Mycobacteriales bacterium]